MSAHKERLAALMNAHEERMLALVKAEIEGFSRERLIEYILLQRQGLRECQKQLRAALKKAAE